jgi:hypothetical protein
VMLKLLIYWLHVLFVLQEVSPEVDEHGNLLPPSDNCDLKRPPTQQKPFMNPKHKDQKWTRVTTSGVRCFYWDVILSFIKFFGFSLSFVSRHFVHIDSYSTSKHSVETRLLHCDVETTYLLITCFICFAGSITWSRRTW